MDTSMRHKKAAKDERPPRPHSAGPLHSAAENREFWSVLGVDKNVFSNTSAGSVASPNSTDLQVSGVA